MAATSLVAGAAARLLQLFPGESGALIRDRLVNDATTGVHGLDMLNLDAGEATLRHLRMIALIALSVMAPAAGLEGQVAQTPNPADYERILIPTYRAAPVPGAYGALWMTELTVRNEGQAPAAVFQSGCQYFCLCGGPCTGNRPVQPGARYGDELGHLIVSDAYGANAGVFVYVEKRAADTMFFNLRVFDASRAALDYGTEIPVVREREFRTATTWLEPVPLDDRFRVHLRLFGITAPAPGAMVRIRIYPEESRTPIYDSVAGFTGSYLDRTGALPTRDNINAPLPGYLEIADLRRALGAAPNVARVRVRIDAQTADLQYWPYVSVTNNVTQQITTITPQ